jgi:aminopeptidase N
MTTRITTGTTVVAFFVGTLLAGPILAQRLPTTISPEHYDLTFTLDLAQARFSGKTMIDVRVAHATRTILLHALELDITAASVGAGGQSQKAAVTLNVEDQTATLTIPKSIPAGRARINIEYRAALNDNLRGLYLSKAGNRSYAVTQFESTDARRAFPCFDEPAFKATFTVTVIADRGDVAISNGRMVSDTPGPTAAQHTMAFSTTAKMSSYLVALAVGDFECLEGVSDNVPIRICATPDKKQLGRIALESAEQILVYLNRYHTIPYPFGKLDVVAVPDFAAGAMENAAAIFYRETDLLADSDTASLATRKNIVSILSHEMAHMWFGDLVTMQWWDDVWLNEGFATWMAPRPAKALKPEWHMDVSEALESQTALNLDSLKATHPIHVTVNTPAEIESVFDPISYEKGASVLRMLESYVGEEAFRAGVNAYLEKHAYANATSEDFFGALSKASGKPVDRVMGTFVLQPGVPEVDVTAKCADGRTTLTLAQRRFSLEAPATTAGRERWEIPMCLKAAGGAQPTCVLVTEPTKTVPLGEGAPGGAAGCTPWVFANAGGRGYYRTLYPADMLKSISRDVETALSAPERLSLVADEWALIRAGRHSVANYLDLVSGFGREPIADVLAAVAGRLGSIDEEITTPSNRPAFRRFVGEMMRPAYREVGFERRADDTEDRRSLRNVIIGALGQTAQDPQVVAKSKAAVNRALQGSEALDPILAGTLVKIAAAHGDEALFDALKRAAARATSPEEHNRYLFALTGFTDPALIRRALDYTLSPEVRSQDAALYLASFFANDAARDQAWAFVKEHWTELEPKVTIALGDINLVNGLSAYCSTEARDDIRSFFAAHRLPTGERALRQTLERIDICVATRQREQPALDQWLAGR